MKNDIDKLTQLFTRFPGIGQRQAKRFVFFLLSKNKEFITDLIEQIKELKNLVKTCDSCFRFFLSEKNQKKLCSICRSSDRTGSLMVVSSDTDLENIEKSGVFTGKYFVLDGKVPILEKSPREKIRINQLLKNVEQLSQKETLKEIILAMDFNPEGDNTAIFVKNELSPLQEKYKFKITTLGKGLSLGTELEYSDPETIKNALGNRR